MNVLKKLWVSAKRNPVINAFVAAALVQMYQDYMSNAIDWGHISGYLATLCFGIIARGFTVPASEQLDREAAAFSKGLNHLDELEGGYDEEFGGGK